METFEAEALSTTGSPAQCILQKPASLCKAAMNISYMPLIDQWFQELPVVYIVFIGICSCVVVGITAMTVLMAIRVHYHVPNEFLMLCLNTTIIIIIRLFGTRRGMAKWLMENEKEVLAPYNMVVIFRCVDTTQMLYTFQKFILDLIAKNGGMGGLSNATPSMVARFWHNVAMTFEVGLLCIVMFRNIRPGKSAFFADSSETDGLGQPVPLANL
ncbi:unnamed protein product [Heligmosomoides polygyrus]|uniref:Anoctamin n=1 Tax=Heligmosomoides polygyrus TaxID=6339 RepID=A0A3P7YWJ9_HELPZ|nr:unnamed protein product [Heligmosomoides polygyrus]